MEEEKLQELLDAICTLHQNVLGKNLTGIYVHGSIAFGCFRWEKSDVDFLVVVKRSLTLEEKMALVSGMLALDKRCPDKGLEMSVVREEHCRPFVYPTPFDLHFSNMHRERCAADLRKYCSEMCGLDKDLAAHFTVTRAVGYPLLGPSVHEIFGEVPSANYLDSVLSDVGEAVEGMDENPVYYILNLCRVLAYLRSGRVLSKVQGGQWGLSALPEERRAVVAAALDAYQYDIPFNVSAEFCHAFAADLLAQIAQ